RRGDVLDAVVRLECIGKRGAAAVRLEADGGDAPMRDAGLKVHHSVEGEIRNAKIEIIVVVNGVGIDGNAIAQEVPLAGEPVIEKAETLGKILVERSIGCGGHKKPEQQSSSEPGERFHSLISRHFEVQSPALSDSVKFPRSARPESSEKTG